MSTLSEVTRLPASSAPAATQRADSDEAKLRRAAQQMEGTFVQYLFKAMRETVPESELMGGGSGEDIFTSLMDQHLAEQVPTGWNSDLGEALFRQLRGQLSAPPAAVPGTTDT